MKKELQELKEKEINLSNELRKIRVDSFDTADQHSAKSKQLMRCQQQISVIESNKKKEL